MVAVLAPVQPSSHGHGLGAATSQTPDQQRSPFPSSDPFRPGPTAAQPAASSSTTAAPTHALLKPMLGPTSSLAQRMTQLDPAHARNRSQQPSDAFIPSHPRHAGHTGALGSQNASSRSPRHPRSSRSSTASEEGPDLTGSGQETSRSGGTPEAKAVQPLVSEDERARNLFSELKAVLLHSANAAETAAQYSARAASSNTADRTRRPATNASERSFPVPGSPGILTPIGGSSIQPEPEIGPEIDLKASLERTLMRAGVVRSDGWHAGDQLRFAEAGALLRTALGDVDLPPLEIDYFAGTVSL